MYEILVLLVLLAWIVFSIWLAARVARMVRRGALKALIFLVLAPVLSALPLADEIIGKFQFDRLCREAEEVTILATLPVGQELYFPDGKWRLSSSPRLASKEYNEVKKILESVIRSQTSGPVTISAWIPINEYEERIYDRDGRLLATYRHYGTRGGWLSRRGEKPAIVRDQCFPRGFGPEMMQRILPFIEKKEEGR